MNMNGNDTNTPRPYSPSILNINKQVFSKKEKCCEPKKSPQPSIPLSSSKLQRNKVCDSMQPNPEASTNPQTLPPPFDSLSLEAYNELMVKYSHLN